MGATQDRTALLVSMVIARADNALRYITV